MTKPCGSEGGQCLLRVLGEARRADWLWHKGSRIPLRGVAVLLESSLPRRLSKAPLGGCVVKKRVPLPGRGKSGGTRTLLATNKDSLWFFVFGFEKSERANVSPRELEALKVLAADLLKLSSAELDRLGESKALEEICHEHKN
jgi:hypothetical protein